MYVITGATGNTGSVVAEQLLAVGKPVRIIVRSADKGAALAKKGAEVAVADLNDERAYADAIRGAKGLYLLSPPDVTTNAFIAERKALTERLAGVVAAAKVEHVVLLSSIAAQLPSGTGPIVSVHNAEQQLRATGVPATFIRAAYFVENWAAVLPVAKKDGVLPSFFPANQRMPMTTTRDIGIIAAQALLDGPRGVRIIELTSEDASATDVARAVGEVLGRTIRVAEAPLDAVVPTFTSFGMSANAAGLYRELYESALGGHLVWEGGKAEAVRGKTSIKDALAPMLR